MNKDLGIPPTVYRLGAGIFFLGYFLFEVPSNLILERGRRAALDRAHHDHLGHRLGADGLRAAARPASTSLRFLLGVAEAGFFPGIILYLTYWFPAEYAPASRLVHAARRSPPDRRAGLGPALGDGRHDAAFKGWQWLFIIEGIPSVLLGFVAWFY